jgi:hypothetical protein
MKNTNNQHRVYAMGGDQQICSFRSGIGGSALDMGQIEQVIEKNIFAHASS